MSISGIQFHWDTFTLNVVTVEVWSLFLEQVRKLSNTIWCILALTVSGWFKWQRILLSWFKGTLQPFLSGKDHFCFCVFSNPRGHLRHLRRSHGCFFKASVLVKTIKFEKWYPLVFYFCFLTGQFSLKHLDTFYGLKCCTSFCCQM